MTVQKSDRSGLCRVRPCALYDIIYLKIHDQSQKRSAISFDLRFIDKWGICVDKVAEFVGAELPYCKIHNQIIKMTGLRGRRDSYKW